MKDSSCRFFPKMSKTFLAFLELFVCYKLQQGSRDNLGRVPYKSSRTSSIINFDDGFGNSSETNLDGAPEKRRWNESWRHRAVPAARRRAPRSGAAISCNRLSLSLPLSLYTHILYHIYIYIYIYIYDYFFSYMNA